MDKQQGLRLERVYYRQGYIILNIRKDISNALLSSLLVLPQKEPKHPIVNNNNNNNTNKNNDNNRKLLSSHPGRVHINHHEAMFLKTLREREREREREKLLTI